MAEFGREQGEKQRKWCHGLAAYPMGWKGVYGEPSAAALSSQLGQNSSKAGYLRSTSVLRSSSEIKKVAADMAYSVDLSRRTPTLILRLGGGLEMFRDNMFIQ
jgi:hypothetical protein